MSLGGWMRRLDAYSTKASGQFRPGAVESDSEIIPLE
jgi:hypothetical protein